MTNWWRKVFCFFPVSAAKSLPWTAVWVNAIRWWGALTPPRWATEATWMRRTSLPQTWPPMSVESSYLQVIQDLRKNRVFITGTSEYFSAPLYCKQSPPPQYQCGGFLPLLCVRVFYMRAISGDLLFNSACKALFQSFKSPVGEQMNVCEKCGRIVCQNFIFLNRFSMWNRPSHAVTSAFSGSLWKNSHWTCESNGRHVNQKTTGTSRRSMFS